MRFSLFLVFVLSLCFIQLHSFSPFFLFRLSFSLSSSHFILLLSIFSTFSLTFLSCFSSPPAALLFFFLVFLLFHFSHIFPIFLSFSLFLSPFSLPSLFSSPSYLFSFSLFFVSPSNFFIYSSLLFLLLSD